MTLAHTNKNVHVSHANSPFHSIHSCFQPFYTLLTNGMFPTQYPTKPVNLLYYRNHLHTSYTLINTYTQGPRSFTNTHIHIEHAPLSLMHKHAQDKRYTLPHPSYTHIAHQK